jgi:ABC-type branched-subunit amino acid transport system ATPase component
VLGLIGPNGAGKTTLFECVAGVLPTRRQHRHATAAASCAKERSSRIFYPADAIAPWPSKRSGGRSIHAVASSADRSRAATR